MTCRWQNLGKLSLLVTLTLGIIYRLQFAGIHFSLFDHKNLHQAHTHMGFYGALAGLVMAQKIFSSHTILKPMWKFIFYTALLLLSFLGFFWDGYNLLTKILSFFIFLIWLIDSYEEFSKAQDKSSDWNATSFYTLIAAIGFLGLIVFHRVFPMGLDIDKLVKGFLLILLAGHFTPKAMSKLQFKAPNSAVWLILELVAAFGIIIKGFESLTSLALCLIGLLVFLKQAPGTFHFQRQTWPVRLWLLHGLLLFPFNFFYDSHFVAIAGIHFWILGPITVSLFNFNSDKALILYVFALLNFALTLSLMDQIFMPWIPLSLETLHLTAAALGGVLVLSLVLDFYQIFEKTINPNP